MSGEYPSSSTVDFLKKQDLYVVLNTETWEVSTGTTCRGVPKLYKIGNAKSVAKHLTNKTGVRWTPRQVALYPVYGED